MESLNEDTIKAGIESALYQVKIGAAYVHGLSEEDFEHLRRGDEGLVNKLFKYVADRMAPALPPENKKPYARKDVKEMLRSRRDKWLKVIQDYDGTEPTDRKETAAVKKESDGDVDMDVDTQQSLKTETGTPKPPKTESDVTSAVVTGTSSSEKAGVKNEPTDMDVEPTVKVESEKPASQDADAGVDAKESVKEEASVEVKQESTSHNGKSKLEMETSDEKRPASMDADEPVKKKKKSETPQTSSKKRKSDDDVDVKKTPRKKAKGSKGPRKIASVKKKRARKNAGPSEAQLEAARESAKKEFEQEKARILAELPEEYTKRWGQVGYARWGKDWLPCLIVGPFNVGAGTNMREEWMSMYENTRNRRHQMTNLVYWYGQADLSDAFSFVPPKNFVAYDKGVEKGYDKLPNKIQKKLESEKNLTKAERALVAGHDELNADLLKQPEERISFDGYHELYEDDDYVQSLLDAEDSEDELFSSDDDESLVSSASSSSELESDSDDDDEKLAQAKAKKAKKKADKKKAAVVEPMEEEELSFVEDEVSSDDSKDEDVILSDESSSDDEQDEDYLASEPGAKKRKRGEPKKKKVKKEKTSTEGMKSKKPKKPRREEKKPSEIARNRAEHKKFRENKEEFLPIVEKWKAAIKNEDTDAIDQVLKSILGRVHLMGAPFMEEYNISPLMMATKKVLRDKNADRTTQKKLLAKLGEQHKAQKALVPPNFTLKNQKLDKKAKRKDGKPGKSAKKPKREDTKEAEPASLNRNESASSLPGSLPASQSSAGPATPARRVHSQGSATPGGGKISPKPAMPQGSAKATTQKAEKMSFSLSSLFSKPTSSQSKSDAGGSSERPSSQTAGATKSLPSWMTAATPDDVGKLPSEKVDRLLALEFFQGTASCFPEEKVNREAIARSLEAAVYQWSLEQYKKEDAYWPKLHTVVAGICGKRKPGTLVAAMMAGEYESARDVVTLSDDMLMHSFEGS